MVNLPVNELGMERRSQNGLRKKVFVTERDKKMIRFVCEIKFASRTDVYERFFKVLADGTESKSMRWALERLSYLEQDGLLKRVRNFDIQESFFLATPKGYEIGRDLKSSQVLPKPSEKIDVRVFDHGSII